MKNHKTNKYNNMSAFTLKRKAFTVYDETDNLKRMKDSDILAEKKKEKPSLAPSVLAAGTGAAAGGLIGAGIGLATKKGARLKGAGKLGKAGAIVGASVMAVNALNKRSKEKQENQFYNDRLEYAQRQAVRRERKDWKSNMTQREGYSY